MKPKNKVFIATSLDGFIADKQGGIDWLDTFPELNTIDTGYYDFMAKIDALVMGRNTFEKVLSFGIDWPYEKPVFVLSNTLTKVPEKLKSSVFIVQGPLKKVLEELHGKGFHQLYIDGGKVIQSFLKQDLIDELIITIVPILLGEGIPLFAPTQHRLTFECVSSTVYLEKVVQNRYIRNRN